MLSNSSTDIRLLKKSLYLVADLAESQLEFSDKAEPPFFSNHLFLKSVVDLLALYDLDLQEKVFGITLASTSYTTATSYVSRFLSVLLV